MLNSAEITLHVKRENDLLTATLTTPERPEEDPIEFDFANDESSVLMAVILVALLRKLSVVSA